MDKKPSFLVFIGILVIILGAIIEISAWKIYPTLISPESIPPIPPEWQYFMYTLSVILIFALVLAVFFQIAKPPRMTKIN